MPIQPFAEFRPDVSDFQADYTAAVNNVVPRGDGYGPFEAYSAYSAALPATCRGFFKSVKSDGTVKLFGGTSTKLYAMDNTTLAWSDVSKAAGTYTALGTAFNWQFAQFGNLVIAVSPSTVPQVFDLSSSSAFADLGGSPPTAAYISIVGRFIVLSGLASNPYRIHWSGLNAATTWTSGTNSSDYQDLPDGGRVLGVAGGENSGTIFQDGSIRRMLYAPGSPLIFQIERVSEDIGLYAPYSVIRAGSRIFFLSSNGFNQIAPGGRPQPIGRERVDRTFLADLDNGSLQLLQGAADPRSSRVCWAYKSTAGAAGLFDKLMIYDYVLDRWSIAGVSGEYLSSASQPGLTLDALDAISSSVDTMTTSFDDYAAGATPEIAMFNSAHKLGFFRGAPLEATMETAEQGLDGNRVMVRGFRPITDSPTVYGSVSYRENQASTASYSTESLNNAQGLCPQRVSTRYPRGKIRIPAGTSWTYAMGIEPDAVVLGLR